MGERKAPGLPGIGERRTADLGNRHSDLTASIDGINGSLRLTIVPLEVQVAVGAKEVVFD